MYIFIFIFTYLSIYLSIFLSFFLSLFLSYLSIYLSIYLLHFLLSLPNHNRILHPFPFPTLRCSCHSFCPSLSSPNPCCETVLTHTSTVKSKVSPPQTCLCGLPPSLRSHAPIQPLYFFLCFAPEYGTPPKRAPQEHKLHPREPERATQAPLCP